MENIYYGPDRIVEVMEKEEHNMLFYVSHNTPEMFEEYQDFCAEQELPLDEESSAVAYLRHIEEQL